jgi:16S rRNA (uracil1498-N3)-methyltransferase
MRTNIGQTVELINGKGMLAHAMVKTLNKSCALLEIISTEVETKKLPFLSLSVGLMKSNKIDFVIEKATELLVDEICFFPAQLSEKKELSLLRAHNIAISATKQCGRLFLPKIKLLNTLKECPNDVETNILGELAFDTLPLKDLIEKYNLKNNTMRFFIGPEKGFSSQEKTWIKETLNAYSTTLALTTLRSETAAIIAVGLLRHLQI